MPQAWPQARATIEGPLARASSCRTLLLPFAKGGQHVLKKLTQTPMEHGRAPPLGLPVPTSTPLAALSTRQITSDVILVLAVPDTRAPAT